MEFDSCDFICPETLLLAECGLKIESITKRWCPTLQKMREEAAAGYNQRKTTAGCSSCWTADCYCYMIQGCRTDWNDYTHLHLGWRAENHIPLGENKRLIRNYTKVCDRKI